MSRLLFAALAIVLADAAFAAAQTANTVSGTASGLRAVPVPGRPATDRRIGGLAATLIGLDDNGAEVGAALGTATTATADDPTRGVQKGDFSITIPAAAPRMIKLRFSGQDSDLVGRQLTEYILDSARPSTIQAIVPRADEMNGEPWCYPIVVPPTKHRGLFHRR